MFWAISLLLGMADESQIFSHALAAALAAAAKLLLATSVFARLIDQNGVAVAHFGWDEPSLNFSARALRRFSVVFVLLIFLASLNGLDYAPYANRESLGFLAFILAMLALAGFFAYLFKTSSPPVRRLIIYQPHSWMLRFHKLWYFVLIAVPLSVAGLALAGYYAAAGYFFSRVLYSAFFVIGAITLYGLIALWAVSYTHLFRWPWSRPSRIPGAGTRLDRFSGRVHEPDARNRTDEPCIRRLRTGQGRYYRPSQRCTDLGGEG